MNQGCLTILAWGTATIIVFALVGLIIIPALNNQTRTQTASASTDYFSLSCSQLKDMVNQLNAQGDNDFGSNGFNGGSYAHGSQFYSKSTMVLQIMQMKRCTIQGVNSP